MYITNIVSVPSVSRGKVVNFRILDLMYRRLKVLENGWFLIQIDSKNQIVGALNVHLDLVSVFRLDINLNC